MESDISFPTILEKRYFDWLCRTIAPYANYTKLLAYLHQKSFYYIMERDGNREADGIDLRYRYGQLHGISSAEVCTLLDDKPCSILEMMVALAIKCEEQIMGNASYGDRTSRWFWDMIESIGIIHLTNENFSKTAVDLFIKRLLRRRYHADGQGGLFTLKNCEADLRNVEIWAQANWYCDEVLKNDK